MYKFLEGLDPDGRFWLMIWGGLASIIFATMVSVQIYEISLKKHERALIKDGYLKVVKSTCINTKEYTVWEKPEAHINISTSPKE